MLKKIKLQALSDAILRDKEMGILMGGRRTCKCSCLYADRNGSTSAENSAANYALGEGGGYSSGGCNNYWTTDFDDGPLTDYANMPGLHE